MVVVRVIHVGVATIVRVVIVAVVVDIYCIYDLALEVVVETLAVVNAVIVVVFAVCVIREIMYIC